MKNIYTLTLLIVGLAFFSSCNYLDIVPDERPTDKDAFKDARAAENYLYSCYSYLPDPRNGTSSIDFFTSDEIVTAFEHETFAHFPKGNYTAANPIISYWNTLFKGIRQCYILIDNINSVPNLPEEDKKIYAAEAKFLIAYYHYLLLKCYGATMIIDKTPDVGTLPADFPARSTYDDCVKWIADKFDEAINSGLKSRHSSSAYGRATSTAAYAIKARMLLYAASPLFNGAKSSVAGTDDVSAAYANPKYVDANGKPLFNTTYDASKWQVAADACKKAIEETEAQGYKLYDNGTLTQEMPEPVDPTQRKLRMTYTDKTTSEVIWASTRREETYSLQNKSTPFLNGGSSYNGVSPTLTMVEMFYTQNGLPINEDPDWDYANRYNYSPQANGLGVTMNVNMKREPRFEAWIGYHNSNYEVVRDNKNKVLVQFRKNDNCGIGARSNNYSPTGYLNKKGVHPLYSKEASRGDLVHYPYPVIRLGELYLSYAEALIEVGGAANIGIAKQYIDKIRNRAGLKGVDESWSVTGITLDQNKMRQIVRQERTIELYLENQRFWDVRRWLLGQKYFGVLAKGMNITGATDDDFFKVQEVQFVRKFIVPNHYLMPIPQGDLDNNIKLIQNPGY